MKTLDLQRALQARGYNPGPIDGLPGRMTTSAVKAFQADHGLKVDGIAGPKTIASINAKQATVIGVVPVLSSSRSYTPWMESILSRIGLHETRDKKALWDFLRSDKSSVGDPAVYPWCGDLVQTPLALVLPDESLPANPFLARNWQKFGVHCKPTYGCVLVFNGGSRPPPFGHVGYYVGEDAGHYYVLGGNQNNAITVMKLAKSRLIDSRWPATVALGPTDKRGPVTTAQLSTAEG